MMNLGTVTAGTMIASIPTMRTDMTEMNAIAVEKMEYPDTMTARHTSEYTHRDRYRVQDRSRTARDGRDRSRSPARMDDATREAKLAAMMSDARKLDDQRNAWIDKVNAEEKSQQAEEDQARDDAHDHSKWREGGGTGKAAFLLDQQRSLWGEQSGGMDLHERLRRSRHGLQRVGAED
ncbi:hypothetical protein MBRA1_000611 [Malassezia brasiliensis]|uniref:Uncharacterized protein n=1 Tax=Malassezia brasiliensis TaxID=1821822 RepID=A0AAF0DU09_9BASI|nr:hypothetical protein MBRA1_000611 [Malassezia brasiliensis]